MPPLLRYGMVVVLLQCLAMAAYIVSLLISQFGGGTSTIESDSAATGYIALGTAIFLAIIFGFVAYVAVSTLRGQPRSQGAILLIEAILVGVAFYMFRGGVPLLGTATLATSAFVLLSLLHPDTRRFEEARYALRNGR
ncbi:hypothetical protein JKI95_03960 [Corynebacterium aquatimens]|nr:hypothetical protein JKI95_03960 [Corynebacterium aquatimens]UIZ93292.1 hypothetical protein JZY91_02230 [Corynebacterium sp. CNCTC7651]